MGTSHKNMQRAVLLLGVACVMIAAADMKQPAARLDDGSTMLEVASYKVYVICFYKGSQTNKADQQTALDGLGGDLVAELDQLSEISQGKFGVGLVDVEKFPVVAQIYKIKKFPEIKLFRDSKSGDYGGVRHADTMKSFLETMQNPALQLLLSTVSSWHSHFGV